MFPRQVLRRGGTAQASLSVSIKQQAVPQAHNNPHIKLKHLTPARLCRSVLFNLRAFWTLEPLMSPRKEKSL